MSGHFSERANPRGAEAAGDQHAPAGDDRAENDRLVAPSDESGLPPMSLVGGDAGDSALASEERAAGLGMAPPQDDTPNGDRQRRQED